MNELKPCPFCGGQAQMKELRSRYRKKPLGRYRVVCGTKLCPAKYIALFWASEEEAADAWNRRGEK